MDVLRSRDIRRGKRERVMRMATRRQHGERDWVYCDEREGTYRWESRIAWGSFVVVVVCRGGSLRLPGRGRGARGTR